MHYIKAKAKKLYGTLEKIEYPDELSSEARPVIVEIEDVLTNYSFTDVEIRIIDSKLDLLETILMF